MEKFAYLVLSAVVEDPAPSWAGSDGVNYGINLPGALNRLGNDGWELVCASDVRGSQRAELFLKKRIP